MMDTTYPILQEEIDRLIGYLVELSHSRRFPGRARLRDEAIEELAQKWNRLRTYLP